MSLKVVLNRKRCSRIISLKNIALTQIKWAPVTTAWRVLSLRIEETTSRYGG